jgi:phosphonate transport system substrate-binding protein
MPQYFLGQAGLKLEDFNGEAGFSGSHDKTLKLVEAGTYEVGVLNEQVWKSRLANGEVDTSRVKVLWTTPAYYDYHWVLHPNVAKDFGPDFPARIQTALLRLDPAVPAQKEILDLFGAQKFIETVNENYASIEAVARVLGKIK